MMEVEVVLSKLTEQIRAELGWHVFPSCIPLLLSEGYAASVQLSSSGWVPFMVLHAGDEVYEAAFGRGISLWNLSLFLTGSSDDTSVGESHTIW